MNHDYFGEPTHTARDGQESPYDVMCTLDLSTRPIFAAPIHKPPGLRARVIEGFRTKLDSKWGREDRPSGVCGVAFCVPVAIGNVVPEPRGQVHKRDGRLEYILGRAVVDSRRVELFRSVRVGPGALRRGRVGSGCLAVCLGVKLDLGIGLAFVVVGVVVDGVDAGRVVLGVRAGRVRMAGTRG